MKRNVLFDPVPATFAQIVEALIEKGWSPTQCSVTVMPANPSEDRPLFAGTTAHVAHEDGEFETAAFSDDEALVSFLVSAGFAEIDMRTQAS